MNTIIQKHIYAVLITHLVILFSAVSSFAEPSLIWEKKFDSRIVKTSRLMDMESKSGKRPDFPLRSVLTERSLFVLDNRGDIAKKISLKGYSETTLSDDGMTMAGLKGNEIILSDLNNEMQGTIKIGDPQPEILPQHVKFELSPDGEFIVILSSFSHTIYFHNRDGELLSKEKVADLKGAEIKFSDDSKYAVIHVPNWGKGKTNGYLLFFDDKGEKLWRFDHKGCQASFDISGDGKAVVIAAEGRLYSLNRKGEIVYEKEFVPGDMMVCISQDGGYLAVAQRSDGSVLLVDNRDGHGMWLKKIDDFGHINSLFTSLGVSWKGEHTAVAMSKDWTIGNKESSLFIFDKSGHIGWEHTFHKDRIECNLSADGRRILLEANRDVCFYQYME
jgi:WD40 repeat protein